MGRAAAADLQLVWRFVAMVGVGMAGVAAAGGRVWGVYSDRGGQRYLAQRIYLRGGDLFLPGAGDNRILFSYAGGSGDRARDNLFCGVRAAGGRRDRLCRGRV